MGNPVGVVLRHILVLLIGPAVGSGGPELEGSILGMKIGQPISETVGMREKVTIV